MTGPLAESIAEVLQADSEEVGSASVADKLGEAIENMNEAPKADFMHQLARQCRYVCSEDAPNYKQLIDSVLDPQYQSPQ